jgi:murein DD-endopeptidase MepM/ murein hydrolase activator NlpD
MKFKKPLWDISSVITFLGIFLVLGAVIPTPAFASNLYSEAPPTIFQSAADLNAIQYHNGVWNNNALVQIQGVFNGNSPIGVSGTAGSVTTYAPSYDSSTYSGSAYLNYYTCDIPFYIRPINAICLGTYLANISGVGGGSTQGTLSYSYPYLTYTFNTPQSISSNDYASMSWGFSNQPSNVYDHTLGGIGGTSTSTCMTWYYDAGSATSPYSYGSDQCISVASTSFQTLYQSISDTGGYVRGTYPADYSLPLDPSDYSGVISWFDHDATSSQMTRYDGTVFFGNDADPGAGHCVNGEGCYDGHHGVDLGTHGLEGKNVLAAASGTVATLGWECPSNHNQGYGYYMRLYHSQFGESTIYAHATTTASFFSVTDSVARGDTILLSGTTGAADGPHLHFGVTIGDTADPLETIDPFGWTGTSTDPRTNDKGYLWKTNPPSL